MKLLLLFLILFPALSSFAESINFLEGDIFDFELGPGYVAGDNIRIHSTKNSQKNSWHNGLAPLYHLRLGPIIITNTYRIQSFTKGERLRLGILITYTGDYYRANGVAEREQSVFAGGFLGYKALTLYSYTDMMQKSRGSIFTLSFSPAIYKSGNNIIYMILNAEHMNRPYVDYYFGIRSTETSPELPAYQGIKTNNFSASFLYNYKISTHAKFMVWAGEKLYGPGVTDSPTVGKKFEFSSGVGWLFLLL